MYEKFERLLMESNQSAYHVAKNTGISQSTLSEWKTKQRTPTVETLVKLARHFGVPVSYFTDSLTEADKTTEQSLTARDQRDIAKTMGELRERLMNEDGLMFDGEPLSPEALESILNAMQLGLQAAKQQNKEKYTPKKYRNPQE